MAEKEIRKTIQSTKSTTTKKVKYLRINLTTAINGVCNGNYKTWIEEEKKRKNMFHVYGLKGLTSKCPHCQGNPDSKQFLSKYQ
jgi:hypothetical protein